MIELLLYYLCGAYMQLIKTRHLPLCCFEKDLTLGEQAEVAMAVLPLLLQTKAGACRHKDFVQFVLVSFIHFFSMQVLQKRIVVITFWCFGNKCLTLQSCDRSL